MRLYIAVVESDKRKGRRVKLAIHASTKKAAEGLATRRFAKWTLQTLTHAPGQRCIPFLDEYPG